MPLLLSGCQPVLQDDDDDDDDDVRVPTEDSSTLLQRFSHLRDVPTRRAVPRWLAGFYIPAHTLPAPTRESPRTFAFIG